MFLLTITHCSDMILWKKNVLLVLVKVINFAALGEPSALFVYRSHGKQDMGVGVPSLLLWMAKSAIMSLETNRQQQKRRIRCFFV